jgi:hypothetical protein
MEEDSYIGYKKYYHDIPKQYCCRAMREGVEGIEFIQYCERFDEYTFSSYNGYALSRLRYCPYCGKEIPTLRFLYTVRKADYQDEKGWKLDEVERYWDLYRQGKSEEEAERIVEQERTESKEVTLLSKK